MAFLRDLAHVSDQPPNAFVLRIALEENPDPAAPSSHRFLLRKRLGAGGFGIVYEALDRERHATVALKALRRKDGRSIARFKNEFRSLVETVHENLVQLYELHAEGDTWFFTMELIQGGNALSYIRPSGGPCDVPRLRNVLRQLAAGLSFLHRSGKLHRDVKPSNVMVTDEGRVLIVDFGLVSDITDLDTAKVVCGTPAYMAPELAAGLPASTATDWYAVGVMIYEALTGQLPDPTSPPRTPSTLVTNVPDDLDQLCVDLLAHNPELRPTGRDVLRRLGQAAHDVRQDERSGGGETLFIGRALQLGELRAALVMAERGQTVTVLVHGRSGMGKSSLVQRFLHEVRYSTPERLVLSGRCFEQESVPYKGIDGLIDDLCQRLRERSAADIAATLPADFPMLARLFPQLEEIPGIRSPMPIGLGDEGDDDLLRRQRAFVALRELLGRTTAPVPVLVVEDLQWGDLDATALLGTLLNGQTPLFLMVSYRMEDAETNPVLGAFFATLGALEERIDVRRIEVGALDDHDAEALSRALLAADDRSGVVLAETTRLALVAEAHGDPFLIAELTQHFTTGAPHPLANDAVSSWKTPLSTERSVVGEGLGVRRELLAKPVEHPLSRLLAARISVLPEPTRRLLEMVALDGQPIARVVAEHAAYGSDGVSEALGAISVLRKKRLIRIQRTHEGEQLLPYHDRIRQTVTQGLAPNTGRYHHHRLALAFVASGTAEPERLLFHFRGAGQLDNAANYAAIAARKAHEALAFDRAARLYREALALGKQGLRLALADALAGAGRPREAAHAYLDAARDVASAESLPLHRRAAELLLGAGYVDDGLATLRNVLNDVDVKVSASLPRSLLGYATLRLRLGARGLAFRERSESAVCKRDLLRIDACYAAALGLFLTNPILAAESQARHLLLALEAGEPFRVARALSFEAVFTAVQRGPGSSTDRLLETARSIEKRLARPYLTGIVHLCESQVLQICGRWRRAHDLAVESESVLRRHCTGVSLEIDLARFRRTDLLWNLGEVAELSRVVPAVVEEARERGNRFLEMTVQLSNGSLLGLVEGRPDRAKKAVVSTLERWPRVPGSMVHVREIRALARIALYEGRGHETLACIDDGLSAMRRTGLILAATQTGELRILRALAALSIGDDAAAAKYTRDFARLGFRWTQNPERIVKAGLAYRAGHVDHAIALLGHARTISREQGATLYTTAMSRRLGEWMGGAEGRAQVEAADELMTGQGIIEPERLTAMLLGWVWPRRQGVASRRKSVWQRNPLI